MPDKNHPRTEPDGIVLDDIVVLLLRYGLAWIVGAAVTGIPFALLLSTDHAERIGACALGAVFGHAIAAVVRRGRCTGAR